MDLSFSGIDLRTWFIICFMLDLLRTDVDSVKSLRTSFMPSYGPLRPSIKQMSIIGILRQSLGLIRSFVSSGRCIYSLLEILHIKILCCYNGKLAFKLRHRFHRSTKTFSLVIYLTLFTVLPKRKFLQESWLITPSCDLYEHSFIRALEILLVSHNVRKTSVLEQNPDSFNTLTISFSSCPSKPESTYSFVGLSQYSRQSCSFFSIHSASSM